MFLREIVQALERVEQDQEKVLRRLSVLEGSQLSALSRIEQSRAVILGRLDALEKQAVLSGVESSKTANTEKAPDEWLQQGIDNIMNYQAGKKKEDLG